jgi:hypothetical protein
MKIALFVIAAAMVAGSAQAYPGHGRGHWHRDRWGHHHRHGSDVAVGVACAPEVLQGNVAATDRTLATLANSPEFATAATFKDAVKEISAVQAADDRAADYFALIGVDVTNKDQVVEFIGARQLDSKYVVELQRQTGLNDAQATKVATELQSTLRGNLQ